MTMNGPSIMESSNSGCWELLSEKSADEQIIVEACEKPSEDRLAEISVQKRSEGSLLLSKLCFRGAFFALITILYFFSEGKDNSNAECS
jgi:hypothetical protein